MLGRKAINKAVVLNVSFLILFGGISAFADETGALAQSKTGLLDPEISKVATSGDTIDDDEDTYFDETKEERKLRKKNFKILRNRSDTLKKADTYFTKGNYKQAAKTYGIILGADNTDAFVNYKMGLSVYRLESYAEARPYFEKALLVDPNIYEAYSTLSASYILEGKIDEAQTVFERLKSWRKQCGLMCVGDNAAFKAEYEIDGMLAWARFKQKNGQP